VGPPAGPVRRRDGAGGVPERFFRQGDALRGTFPVARGVVRTNEPFFHEGYGIYIKNFGTTPWGAPYAVFDANRDPGASAILVASMLFTAANLLYLYPSRRTDRKPMPLRKGLIAVCAPAGPVDAGG